MGYLAPGSLILYSFYLIDKEDSVPRWSTGNDIVDGALLLLGAYVAGHMLLWISRIAIQKPARVLLGKPENYLLIDSRRKIHLPHDDFNRETKAHINSVFEKEWSKQIINSSVDLGDLVHFCTILVHQNASEIFQAYLSRLHSLMRFYRSLALSAPFLALCVPMGYIFRITAALVSLAICFRGFWWNYTSWHKNLYGYTSRLLSEKTEYNRK